MLNQRILLIHFAAALLCEKWGVPLKGHLTGVIKGLKTASSKHPISLLMITAQILDEFPVEVEMKVHVDGINLPFHLSILFPLPRLRLMRVPLTPNTRKRGTRT